ncbi:MAG: nickel pincer cofactor biosynthesis protein LarB [Lentisphaerota bacterium]
MNDKIAEILERFKTNEINAETACSILSKINESVLMNGEVRLDESRSERCGFPEFIFGSNKNEEQLIQIIASLFEKNKDILVTRVNEEVYTSISSKIPSPIKYNKLGKVIYCFSPLTLEKLKTSKARVAILSAGSSDISVAMEAKYTIEICGYQTELFMDIGVAGIHRLMGKIDKIREFDVLIVIAGMEGALPSVVGGLVSTPVIAVPTSVGYGASLGGITAMFSMLNSCANGIAVVNIDSGFGAGCAAVRILNTINSKKK